MSKIIAKVLSEKTCYLGFKPGDEIDISKMDHIKGVCVKDMAPYVNMLNDGTPLPWENDPDKARVKCTSPWGTVVFELRLEED